jgi:predicted DNA-binding transcriptional regulator YafY
MRASLENFYALFNLLQQHEEPISQSYIEQKLGYSQATFFRALNVGRDKKIPIIKIRKTKHQSGGYLFDRQSVEKNYSSQEWFSNEELIALSFLQNFSGSNGEKDLAWNSIFERVGEILHSRNISSSQWTSRFKINLPEMNKKETSYFRKLSFFIIHRKCVELEYHSQIDLRKSIFSPQRLIFDGKSWELDAWSHTDDALLRIPFNQIHQLRISKEICRNLNEEEMNRDSKIL